VLGGQLPSTFDQVDLVVLDPPREGAKALVVEQVVARNPRAVAYVACDPAALGRDVATFLKFGYRVRELRALDMFPMTHHVECVALLEKAGSGGTSGR
jgi:tRNA/tmRNA/rRNA uracil-C5-methylase (TrmA/RlmC/RlmD family)